MTKETKAKPVSVFDPDITLPNKGNIVSVLSSYGGKPSPMKGFDSQFQNRVDYIVQYTDVGIHDASMHHLEKGQFVHEWTLFDEFALMKQINASYQEDLNPDSIPF